MTRQQIVNEARSYVNSPFHHQGRLKGVGVDCLGLITGLCDTFGVTYQDYLTYDHYGRGPDAQTIFRKWFKEIPLEQMGEGDILLMWVRDPGTPCHAGILVQGGMIHTHRGIGKVCEHRMSADWWRRVCGVFQFPGVE